MRAASWAEREMMASLVRSRTIPPKFMLFWEGSRLWERHSRAARFRLGRAEVRFLEARAARILRDAGPGPIGLVDLGPGSGEKGGVLLAALRGAGRGLAYAAVDLSRPTLSKALRRIETAFGKTTVGGGLIADLEAGSIRAWVRGLRENGPARQMILLLGAGNLSGKASVMRNVRRAMGRDDLFLVSAEIASRDRLREVMATYHTPSSRRLLFGGARRLGLRESDCRWIVRYDAGRERIEVACVLARDRDLRRAGTSVRLRRGEQVTLFTSHKPTWSSFPRHLASHGFEVVRLYHDRPEGLALALCRLRRG